MEFLDDQINKDEEYSLIEESENITPAEVKKVIAELKGGKVPGSKVEPVEYYNH